jgi:hypothetical protein
MQNLNNMNKDNKNTELNDTDKKLHISDVRNSIQERIKRHEQYINSSIELIQNEKRPMDVIYTLTEEIKRTEIRISELKQVLEYCL